VCEPDHVVVCGGVRDALSLLAGVLRGAIAVEDPGLFERAEIIAAAGARAHGVAVDDEGLLVRELLAAPVAAAFVTPAHQFPTGVPLSAARRSQLIVWARRGGLIIEDDYDAEFRFDQPPLRALQGLAPDEVVYLGSVSKTLAPALRLGWLVVPARLVEPLAEAKRLRDGGEPVLPQLTFAELLRSGAYDRHLRAARTRYRNRRAALLAALRRHLPGAEVHGIAAGLHVLVALPDTVDIDALRGAADRRRLAISTIDDYLLRASADDRRLVVGFANLDAAAAEAAVRQLAAAIADSAG